MNKSAAWHREQAEDARETIAEMTAMLEADIKNHRQTYVEAQSSMLAIIMAQNQAILHATLAQSDRKSTGPVWA